jgi:hypothetical protein
MECTFAPEIYNRRLNFENIVPKPLDEPTKNFYQRAQNAKKIKEEQESKLNPDYSKK